MKALGDTRSTNTAADDAALTHRFGLLATRLTESLGRGRSALQDHAGLLPPGTLADLDAFLDEFTRRRVRIAIYGEVKAGKSTLLNALAGATLSPVGFDPLTSTPLCVTYGPDTVWRMGGQQLASVEDVERAMRAALAADTAVPGEVVVETDLDLLQLGGQVDLLDTPGVGSAATFDAVSAAALQALDAVVLVVRYPALFTQFTRRLMDGLQADIGKLFVVWNLDADCAELSEAERARHADSLRANVAGAHELFLVNARAAFRATQADDPRAIVASGLSGFIAALARFASSKRREVAALREASKRAHQRLDAAHDCLERRHSELDRLLTDTRARLRAVQASADADSAGARREFADLETALQRIGDDAQAAVVKRAADCRRQLRAARWRWAYGADVSRLAAAVAAATARFADAVHDVNAQAAAAAQATAARFNTAATLTPPARNEPACAALGPGERIAQSTAGRVRRLRRAVWQRWYLPGLADLEADSIGAAVAAQTAWWAGAAHTVRPAAEQTLAARLAEIGATATAAEEAIKAETSFAAAAAECAALAEHLPVLATQRDTLARIAAEARALHTGAAV